MTVLEIIQGNELKSGDTEPDLVVQLRKDNGNPYPVDNHEVRLFIKEVNGDTLLVDDDTTGNVTIDDSTMSKISYSWQSTDTEVPATYIGEVEVEELDQAGDPNGQVATFPSSGHFAIRIQESLS